VLGGEKFPSTNEVEEWQNWNSKTRKRIFNIYGITEMSCWAMIHEVTKDDIIDGKVPLGNLLSQTNFGFLCDSADAFHQGEEHMVLFSTKRYCYVDDRKIENHMEEQDLSIAYYTGDIVKRINGKIYYCGRRDGMIKRLGSRVSLCKIETVASSVLPEVSCIYTKKQLVLFCQTENDAEIADLKTYLRNNLSSSEIPDEILKISFFPLSKHGKVDKHQLKLIFKDLLHDDRKKRAQIEDTFLEAINQMFNLRLGKILNRENSDEPDGKRMKTEIDLTFRALGGSSFDALRISMKLDDIFGVQNIVLPKLLSDHESIRDICSYLKKLEIKNTSKIDNNYLNPGKLSTKVLQTFDMKKCIDATPNVTKDGKFLSVGSHSHEILTIDLEQLQIISRTVLGDRIESEVTFKGYFGFVGCYDGFLYCFNLISGEIQWKFDTQGKIKSKAIICEDFIIIGNYNENSNLLCIGLNGELRWKRLIGSRGILANPLIINDSSILVCSLDGIVEMMDFHGNSQWTKKYEFPIFSSPQIVPGANAILLAEVSRNVHCIDFQGNDLWKYETEGEIFSTFSFQKLNSFETGIIFGCHDKKLRYIKFNNKINSVELKWTCELNSQLFSTPKFTDGNMIVSCSTDGHINFIDSLTGTVQHCHKLPGEIFSTPLIIGQRIFVGCRNNYLYCIEF
jgi:acyl-CoA synthetase